ncbi:sugar O-acyltransferase (sialic acid O-acetyltransferase NeuD family) [Roseivirga pacifica]|uniref:Sugar O-acyltransferase, sialic acid O-acetyltransferase NeuD family n=1 Tax=Roseivirga pacifica TaxID=1267423 RepID=A0A1I0QZR5_9BACT|nr:NeuD/PglB/VioB family sugar acetyltransferase [Roseivirga pacifica]RKQ42299.1 sugar O-acyltransferase (sialic acid O-acetyltransferase NeuD family) [Roseivirga pacifica]SEW33204.1 sugar O-acyltransferase, sialic acid O-acetyltransferase NeuD family [Roseivirga pacifica]
MERVAVIGSGDLGFQISRMLMEDDRFDFIGFYDDFEKVGTKKYGFQVMGNIASLKEHFTKGTFDSVLLGIGYNHMVLREQLYEELSTDIPFATFIHSTSFIDSSASIADGVILYPGCIIDQRVKVGVNCILNLGCTIAHDTTIGAHSFLSPRVALAGFINVGPKVNLGINTIVIDNIDICANTRTGGGAVVTKNIESSGLYLGVPAKLINK